jgi:hypothetical protein
MEVPAVEEPPEALRAQMEVRHVQVSIKVHFCFACNNIAE